MLDTDNDEEVTLLEWCQGFEQMLEKVCSHLACLDDMTLMRRCILVDPWFITQRRNVDETGTSMVKNQAFTDAAACAAAAKKCRFTATAMWAMSAIHLSWDDRKLLGGKPSPCLSRLSAALHHGFFGTSLHPP